MAALPRLNKCIKAAGGQVSDEQLQDDVNVAMDCDDLGDELEDFMMG
jgi:hypothetical protein